MTLIFRLMQEIKIFDDGIWEAFKAGDKKAYAVIYRHYYPRIYNYGRKFSADAALLEDCIQEVFTSFWHHRTQLQKIQELRSYFFVSFRNCLLKAIRRNSSFSSVPISDDTPFFTEISVDQLMIDKEKIFEHRIYLDQAIAQLTERQKEAVFLKYYENLSYEEIARVFNISTKASYKLVARAVSVLRSCYKQKISVGSS